MKKIWAVLLLAGLGVLAQGCGGGEEENPQSGGGAATNPKDGAATTSSNTSPFKSGIESGRAEDGSDEDK